MLSTLTDLGYLISDDGLCTWSNDQTFTRKSMCVSHAIQVSGMNAHFPVFKSDTITMTIPTRGIRG